MKKNYLMGLATLAMIMASCSQNEVLNSEKNGESNVIGFSTYTGKTKAAQSGTATNLPGGFGVTAFLGTEATPYMGATNKGAHINWDTKWKYAQDTDVRYWPATGAETLKFFAYAPFANTNRVVTPTYDSANGMTFTNYEVSATNADQDDFMYASNLSPTSGSAVTLAFNHALTQVLFTVTALGNLKVDIAKDGIDICNVMSKGTFKLTTAAAPSWDVSITATDKKTYKLTSDEVIDITSITTPVAKIGTSLMLMPQTLIAWATTANTPVSIATNNGTGGAKSTYLKISCKIYDNAAQAYILGNATTYGITYVPFGTTWAMNKKITYNLKFGGGFDDQGKPILKPITFEPSVEDWETVTPSTDVPLN